MIVGTNQTFTTGIAGIYCVNVTNGNGCTGKDTVQLITTPVPLITNAQLTKSICEGESANILLNSNVPGTMFYWTASLTSGNITGFSADSGMVINQILTDNLAIPGSVTYQVTPKVGSCFGSPVDFVVTVNPGDSAKVSIVASANITCSGTAVTFTATATNSGTSPIYQWKVNGVNVGNNSHVFSYLPTNGDLVKCILTSSVVVCISNNPAISNTISMIVNPMLPVGVSISSSFNPVCSGIPVYFTAAPVNGGVMPAYQWTVNGVLVGTNSLNFSYVPMNNDIVSCKLTSSETCTIENPVTGNPITLTVYVNLPVNVSISPSSNPFCIGGSVIYTATPLNGGNAPIYQWKVNAVNAINGNNAVFTYNPVSGDLVSCVMTSNLSCVTSNPATSAPIAMIERASPNVTFTACYDTITTINAKPFKLKGGLPVGGTYSGPGVNSITSIFTPSETGTGIKTITYSYNNTYNCQASSTRTIVILQSSIVTCGSPFTDIRDNKTYSTVQLGAQCWMKENLDFGVQISDLTPQTDNCLAEKYQSSIVNRTSSFYLWDELMRYDNVEGIQGLCPPGWHVPTAAEWTTLFNYYQGNSQAGSP
ncbi:MAG: FISUMP domain-containing protein [bacterium]